MDIIPTDPATLFVTPNQPRATTSDVLIGLIERAKQPDITLRSLTNRLGDRTFGMLLVLTAIFTVLPLISIIAGLLMSALGAQLALGMTRARLPGLILDRQLSPEAVRKALTAFEPKVRKIERFIRPRWQFSEAPIVDRLNGLLIMILGIIVAIPLPFTNIGPAFVVILMGLGLMERDGLVQLAAAGIGLACLVMTYIVIIAN